MGAALWGGIATAARYSIPCPACGELARTDCDSLGRTIVICGCRRGAFLMPLTVGGLGSPWPVDVSNLPPDEYHQRNARARKANVPRCGWEGCTRVVSPRSRHCGKCSPIAAATLRPCPEPGCANMMRGYRSERCQPCARKRHRDRATAYRETERASRQKQQLVLVLAP